MVTTGQGGQREPAVDFRNSVACGGKTNKTRTRVTGWSAAGSASGECLHDGNFVLGRNAIRQPLAVTDQPISDKDVHVLPQRAVLVHNIGGEAGKPVFQV